MLSNKQKVSFGLPPIMVSIGWILITPLSPTSILDMKKSILHYQKYTRLPNHQTILFSVQSLNGDYHFTKKQNKTFIQ